MATVRLVDAVDVNGQKVPCRCGEYLIASTDDDGREVWECLECLRRTYPNVGGHATEGAPAVWDAVPCDDCQQPVIWSLTINGRRMPLDSEPVASGIFELRAAGAGLPSAQTVPWERRRWGLRTLYSSHLRTCAARQGVAS